MPEPADTPPSQAIRFSEIATRKLSTQLADTITETILEQDLQPGTRLPSERDMREQFGVGRGTLREALRVLEAEGLITVRSGPRGGPVVAKPDTDRLGRLLILMLLFEGATLRDVYDVRVVVEPLAAAGAARRATPEQVAELEASVQRLATVLDDEGAVIAESQRWHRALAQASGNPVLVALSLSLLSIFDGYAMGARFESTVRAEVVKVHDVITRSIRDRDPAAAERTTLRHVQGSIRQLSEAHPGLLDEPLRPALIGG